jgi:hypothetical protein
MALDFCLSGLALSASATPPSVDIPRIDLVKAFHSRSAWRLVATEGPPAVDYGDNPAPGALRLCFEKGPEDACASPSAMPPPSTGASYDGWEPHYLLAAKVVYPEGPGGAPLLMIVTASMHAGDGGQIVATQLFKYSRAGDAFERVYAHSIGTNNNQEVRFIPGGPLEGAVISAEPTADAPYAYWITVNRFTSARGYRQALRYRSATRYNDGDSLPVIDSEMPSIERRLGLWRPGSPLPLPIASTKPCPSPRLKGAELWCE